MDWITKLAPTAGIILQNVAVLYIIYIIWAFAKARFFWKKSSTFSVMTTVLYICLSVNATLFSFLVVSSKFGIYWAVGILIFGVFPIIPAALIISVIDSLSAGFYVFLCVFFGFIIRFLAAYYYNWCTEKGLDYE